MPLDKTRYWKKKIIPGWPTSSLDWPIVHNTLEIIIQTLKQTLYNFLIVMTGIVLLFLNMKSSHVLTYFVLTESISKEIQNSLYFIFVLKQHSIFLLMALTTLGMQYYAFFFFTSRIILLWVSLFWQIEVWKI